MGLMLTVMLLAIAAPAMAGDNNRQERREERREFREDFHDDFFVIEEIDVDCDDVDDDLDGLIDEGAIVCEVEVEFEDFD